MSNKSFSDFENERQPSRQTRWGLNTLLFFIADVRHGVGPLLSIYLHSDLKWDPSKIGFALAMTDVSSVLSQVPAGLLADASRSKRMLIAISCLSIIMGCAFILTQTSFGALILAQLIMGIAIALITPALGAITLGLFGRVNYPIRASINEMWNHAGNVFIALTAGIVSYLLGHQWIFYIVISCAMISLIALNFIRPNEIDYRVARELGVDVLTGKSVSPTPIRELFKKKAILIFNFSLILYYIANAAQIALVGQVLSNQNPHYDVLFLAGCMLIAECTMIGTAFAMSLIINRFGRKPLFLTAFLFLSLRAVLYTLTDNPFFLLSIQILDGMAAGIVGVVGTVINSDLALGTGRFNFLQGLAALSTSIGASVSNVIAGLIAMTFGFHFTFLILAGIALLGLLFVGLLMPETKIESS